MIKFEKISVIGLGYIGLPTAAMFASRKVKVIGVDINPIAVDTINRGEIHIIEPDLDIVVRAAVSEGYLCATMTPEPAEAFLIAVPTPFKGDYHEPDLKYIEAACKAIARFLTKGNLVVLESTSPVGATEKMASWLARERSDLSFPQSHGEDSDIRIAHCPERVLPGNVMKELISNDRVIGGMTAKCSEFAVSLYKIFVQSECVVTNSRTAEMAKLTENSFRDVNIAFANELSIICDKLDINVWELIGLANRHPRVNILNPGPGVGGHCIAVDPWFIVSSTPQDARIIRTARIVNDLKPDWVIDKIQEAVANFLLLHLEKKPEDVIIACYGVSFKPNIDDIRESPALQIVQKMMETHLGQVLIVDPYVNEIAYKGRIVETIDQGTAFDKANVHVMLVAHSDFSEAPNSGVLVDTQGIWIDHY